MEIAIRDPGWVRNEFLWGYIAPALIFNKGEEGVAKKESREGNAE